MRMIMLEVGRIYNEQAVQPPCYQLIILDFDGVILESVSIKTDAFRELFRPYPEHLDRILAFHLGNLGTSRFDKIRYIYRDILKKDLSPDEYQRLLARYADLVLEKVLRAPFVSGALEFLERFHRKVPLYIVSATPQDEIRFIVQERGLSRYFHGVYGSPMKKVESMREILATSGTEPGSALFVGDAQNDLHAARALGVPFVGRVSRGAANSFLGESDVVGVVNDLDELGKYIGEREC